MTDTAMRMPYLDLAFIKKASSKSKVWLYILLSSGILFSLLYFSFFPGRFSVDSYNTYLMALGKYPLSDFHSPFFAVSWRILAKYNCGPFIIDYVLLCISLMLIYQKLKTTVLPQLVLLCFLLIPPFFISFTYAWKDNVLLSSLLLLVALLIQDNSKKLSYIIAPLLLWTFSLRLNAFFAVLPLLWFYCDNLKYKAFSKKMCLFVMMIIGIFMVNHWIIYKVLHATKVSYIQHIYASDILKINHRMHKNQDLPPYFLDDTSPNNIDKTFEAYNLYHSNDYFFYRTTPKFNPILVPWLSDNGEDNLKHLRTLWIKKIKNNPGVYLFNRYEQWMDAITHVHYISTEPFHWKDNVDFYPYSALFFTEPQYSWMKHVRAFYQPKHLALHEYLFLKPGTPGLYLLLSFILFGLVVKTPLPHRKLIITLLISGVFYSLGYFPVLPSGDYRYFNWTILAFGLALGLWLHDRQMSIHHE